MQEVKVFTITLEDANKIYSYLASCPFAQAEPLIGILRSLKPVVEQKEAAVPHEG